MKKLNLFSNLWSSLVGSQCSDIGVDRRLTVGSPSGRYASVISARVARVWLNGSTRLRVVFDSFTCRLRVSPHLGCILAALFLLFGCGHMWGAEEVMFPSNGTTFNSGWNKTSRTARQAYAASTAAIQLMGENGGTYGEISSKSTYTGITAISIKATASGSKDLKLYYSSNGSSWTEVSTKSISKNTSAYDTYDLTITGIPSTAVYIKFRAGSNSVYIYSVTVTTGGASVATPTFSVAAGTYTSVQSVSISCATAGSTIYYTTDGTTPTSSSTEYSSAISISSSCTLKAIAKKGSDYSSVASASYTINIPYTVTFVTGTNNPTVDPVTEESKGEGIELPDGVTPDCSYDGWVFAGWAKTSITEQNTAPRLYMPGDDYSPDGDENMYAVYRKLTSGTSTATFTSSDLSNLTVISSGKWWVHSATGVEFYIHSYGIYDSKFDIWKSWALIDAHTQIKQVVFTNADATTIDHIALNSAESSAGGNASISGTTTQTITCSGDVSQLYLYSPASSDSYFTAFTVTYYNAKYNSNPTCAACDADPTIGDASLNGSFNMTSTTSAIGVASGTCAAGTSCSWADYGFVWSDGTDTKTPTVSNNKVQVGTSGTATSWTGSVTPSGSTSPTSWTTGHTYYVRTYGKNNKAGAAFTYGSAWSFTPQSVTFKANGGTGDDKVQYLRKSTSTALTANTFTKVGHDFAGWATSSSGSVVYADGASVNIDANLTLHAKWSPKDYTITTTLSNCSWSSAISSPYTYDGATNSITRTVNPSSGYGCPSTITVTMGGSTLTVSTDYTWSVTNGVGSFTLKKAITGNVAITITAQPMVKWMAGGEVFNTQIGTAGTALTSPGTPSNSTYCDGVKVFVGWSASTISGITNTAPSDLFLSVAGKTITAGATYYAIFADKESTDTYKKIESTEDFSGGYYVFATPENAMTNTVSSKVAGSTPVSISSDAISTPGASIIWFVEKSTISSTDYYTLYNANANKFMNIIADGSYGQLSLQTTPATYTAEFDNTNKDIALYSVSRSGQLIEYYNGFKSYNSKGNALIYAYKRKLSNYATTCCDKIVTLSAGSPSNGTVEFTQSSSSVTSVATCSGAQDVTMTINPDNGYKLTSFTVATGDGKVPAEKITTDPAVGTSSNSSAAQEIGLTFAQNASGAYNVTVGFSEMVVTNWSWTNHDGGAALTTDPIEIYVDQQARVDVTYTPAKAQLLSSHTASTYYSHDAAGSDYVKNANKASEYFTFKGKAEGTTTITLTHNDDTSSPKAFQQLIYVKVLPLPLVHFVDKIHGEEFDDVVATINGSNALVKDKPTPTLDDISDPGSNYNTCERNHVHLVGWIRSDWAEEHPGAKDSQITGAGNDASGNAYYYAAGATLDVEAQNGKTFYAVWSKIE